MVFRPYPFFVAVEGLAYPVTCMNEAFSFHQLKADVMVSAS